MVNTEFGTSVIWNVQPRDRIQGIEHHCVDNGLVQWSPSNAKPYSGQEDFNWGVKHWSSSLKGPILDIKKKISSLTILKT